MNILTSFSFDVLFLILLGALPITLFHILHQSRQKKERISLEKEKAQCEFFLSKSREDMGNYHARIETLLSENGFLKASLEQEKKQSLEKINLLKKAEETLQHQFKALSSEIFREHNKHFLELADSKFRAVLEQSHLKNQASLTEKEKAIQNLVSPIQQALSHVDGKIQALEKERLSAYEILKNQVHHLIDAQKELRLETANLVNALRTPQVRGKWGEMQLRRVVEMAGMIEHCDFVEQGSVHDGESWLRPDMVIKLPGGSHIVVDAKAPLTAYLNALEQNDAKERELKLQDHARHVRTHIKALSQRSYFEQFEKSPDFVVLFLPGEMFFSAALEKDPDLLEFGFKDRVILATPTTLIALLRAVAYGWRQESLAQNARAISQLGQEMSKRVSDLAAHAFKLGKNIGAVVDSYNQTIGTLERRVLVSARKFKDFDPACEEIIQPVALSHMPRELQALELQTQTRENDEHSHAQGNDNAHTQKQEAADAA